jgi:glycosyltransferase involved in cell wall biosynthesis
MVSLKILQVSTADLEGGAEKIAFNLFQEYQRLGHTSWLAVGKKISSEKDIFAIPSVTPKTYWGRKWFQFYQRHKPQKRNLASRILRLIDVGMGGREKFPILLGWEDFHFPGSLKLLSLSLDRPDVVHLHNLHGGYFDLRSLQTLSDHMPVFITMHDDWLMTGHCACSMGCTRWITGCGQCPDLNIYPPVYRDATAFNWERKREIYEKSKLYVATPSRWLFDRLQKSMIHPFKAKVINNGIDPNIFYPSEPGQARERLQLPQDAKIILAVANSIKENPFKDYRTLEQAIRKLGDRPNQEPIIFVTVGGPKGNEMLGRIPVYHYPFERDEKLIVNFYQAADVYVHSSHTDNFPTTILESFACGTPVVATAVGGIAEQVEEGITGYLVPAQNSVIMASRIEKLLQDNDLRKKMGVNVRKIAEDRYDIRAQAQAYLDWYAEILDAERL